MRFGRSSTSCRRRPSLSLIAAGAMLVGGSTLMGGAAVAGMSRTAGQTVSPAVQTVPVRTRWAAAPGTVRYRPAEILVKFRPGATLVARRNLRVRGGGVTAKRSIGLPLYSVTLGRGVGVKDALRRYRASSQVEYAEPNYLRALARTPNDTYYRSGQWNMVKTSVDHAWDIATDATSTTVAVIDSGLDLTHPDISGNVWANPLEVPGNSTDDDANGYVDDVNGWNFAVGEGDPSDHDGHGTHVAGIIAAETNNGRGVAGLAGGWGNDGGARLMALRVTNDEGLASDLDIAEAIAYAADNGAKVINMSLSGFELSLTLKGAVESAYHDYDVFVVAAAGNQIEGYPFPYTSYPAAYEHVTAVAATDSSDRRPWWSNYGRFVDVSAPGESIASTYWNLGAHAYAVASGTSMASPHVAGEAALLRSYYPTKTGDEIRVLIQSKCRDLGPHGKDYYTGYGRINVGQTVDTSPPVVADTSATAASFRPGSHERETIRFNLSDDHYASLTVITYIKDRYGRVVRRLGPYTKAVGAAHTVWDGRNSAGRLVAAGTYRCRVRAADGPGNLGYSPYRQIVVLR